MQPTRSGRGNYVATDRGVFSGRLSLNDAGTAATGWKAIARDLPVAPAWDVRRNADNTLTIGLDGYGVFETAAPHRTRNVRLVSGADLTERPAAHGSLIQRAGREGADGQQRGDGVPRACVIGSKLPVAGTFRSSLAGTFSLALEGATDRWSVPLTVQDAAPAIFVDADGAPLVLDASSGLVLDPKLAVYAGLDGGDSGYGAREGHTWIGPQENRRRWNSLRQSLGR